MSTLTEETARAITEYLERFAHQLSALNEYMREREERVIMMTSPRLIQHAAGDVGVWRKISNVNQYRYNYALFRTTGAGILYFAPAKMERTTQGIPLSASESYPNTRDPHQGQIYVNPDAVTAEAIFVEWVRTPLTPKQME